MDSKIISLGLTFDDVLLEPRESDIARSEAELETNLTRKIKIQIPVVSAAMDTVSESQMAIALGKLGGISILHRNCSIEEQVKMLKKVKKAGVLAGAAIGGTDLERAKALDKAGADIIVIDTAHAHVKAIIQAVLKIKKSIKAQLVVGNIATREAARAFAPFADALKVGIGPGSICTTRVVAGVGVPQLTAIIDVVSVAKKYKVPVIADGGIKYSGDAVKALAAGASSVMLGSMLSGTKEAPGKIVKVKGELYKEYRGMGSLGVMRLNVSTDRYFQKGAKTFVPEGVEALVKYKGPLKEVIEQITGGLRSGMGYLGARTIADIPKRAKFIRITNAGLRESHPHSVFINKKAPNYDSNH
ncbi:MAG: IMP dehydrogenase [Candidatus Doudnabacteria bacterium]|nr:IMP dehydrogenase [Candidatus Doudnabacteria bacterium]